METLSISILVFYGLVMVGYLINVYKNVPLRKTNVRYY